MSQMLSATELWAALLGSVVGAMLTGYIAYRIQSMTLQETKRLHAEERKQKQSSLAHSLISKIHIMYSNFSNIYEKLDRCIALSEEYNQRAGGVQMQQDPWCFLTEVANFPSYINISPEERALLLELKGYDIAGQMLLVDDNHNGVIEGQKRLHLEVKSLTEKIPITETRDTKNISNLNEAEFKKITPDRLKINTLLDSLHNNTSAGKSELVEVAKKISNLLNDELELGYRIDLEGNQSGPAGQAGESNSVS